VGGCVDDLVGGFVGGFDFSETFVFSTTFGFLKQMEQLLFLI
jgi:hypothetical protein